MKFRVSIAIAGAALLAGTAALAQAGNSRARGTTFDADTGSRLPGVTVTFASPNQLGVKAVMTDASGSYAAPPLTPGEYEVTFELDGYQTVTQQVRLNAGQEQTIDARLPIGVVTEELIVTSAAGETISENSTAASTMPYEDLARLPTNRTLNNAVGLAAGVSTSFNNAISISGGQSWDNLFTLNGVVLNENLRGQAPSLFIEDAIQETTVSQAGVSAEYGRFTGGLVTSVTKSGGNEFEGSFRVNLTNEDWRSDNQFSPATRTDSVNETYEATVGGRIVRDRLWFFLAGRDARTSTDVTTLFTNIPYTAPRDESRKEYKLTGAITPSHQGRVAYSEIEDIQFNNLSNGWTLDSLDAQRELPWEMRVVDYTGVVTPDLFVEAQASERTFFFKGSGGSDDDPVTGTPVFDLAFLRAYNEPLFCDDTVISDCTPEERSNEQARLKGSYFLSGASAGSHDIAFGAETFSDIRASDNHQSPNGLNVWSFNPSDINGQVVTPWFTGGDGATYLLYLPILQASQGTDFQTDSVFANDRWRLNDNWSFNVGVRYDKVDAVNAAGSAVADSDAISPRLGATWDLFASGKSVAHLAIGKYTGGAASGIFDSSSAAGTPAAFYMLYSGPEIRGVPTETAMAQLMGWFFDQCPELVGTNITLRNPNLSEAERAAEVSRIVNCSTFAFSSIPGTSTILDEGLETPSADEISLGFSQEFERGSARLDYVHREFGNFFATRTDLSTGQGIDPNGVPFDIGVIQNNDDVLERSYDAVSLNGSFRFLDNKLKVGGNVTWANARGNFDGETAGSGPVTSASLTYPEYKDPIWNNPSGRLQVDQRLRGRVWLLYDLLRTDRNSLNVSLLQNFTSGNYYSAVATNFNTAAFVTNPGYATPPTAQNYFFSGRGEFQTDDITSTDLALNYSFRLGRFEAFIQPQLLNALNEDGAIQHNTTVQLIDQNPAAGGTQTFNPFTTQPIEGTHWRKGPTFGTPTSEAMLQRPRDFQVSFGVRWNPF